ncbi:MAG TPA: O-antigen ligase family protein [Bryobacteraceae bacterium]
MNLPLALYIVLLTAAGLAPLRWALAAYLTLATVDFYTGYGGIGILNALKGLVFPAVLLWRLRAYSGHTKPIVAPIAWLLLVSYVAIASFWSLFPLSAAKLAGEMIGSFLICLAFLRATKGEYLTPSIVLPATAGVLAVAILRSAFLPGYGDTPDRFTGFTSAQTFAALLAALFALALCSSRLRPSVRVVTCTVIAAAMVLNGSRVWLLGLLLMLILALVLSSVATWFKICSLGLAVLLGVAMVAASEPIFRFLAQESRSNRIAALITAIDEGDRKAAGLGTFLFRRQLNARTLDALGSSSTVQLLFGHGTSNGRLLLGDMKRGIGDPNRAVHDEWLRILYEWGIVGLLMWLAFLGSIAAFAWSGVRTDSRGYAKPLLVYLPAFLLALLGENILAGAGHAENIGFILLIAIAGISHRRSAPWTFTYTEDVSLHATVASS